ncbi:hypothetical protein GCM10008931_43740 [Oceanobacillus oncorhynchi subsp. oncorhynchi]|uniref:hypothetical protein n=1 Tax=Oceanobacillus oncorhynchi TaxID=545501 RepID=UPI0031E4981C
METVTWEEHLIAQVKNIAAILESDDHIDVKIKMYKIQKDYLELSLNRTFERLLDERDSQSN